MAVGWNPGLAAQPVRADLRDANDLPCVIASAASHVHAVHRQPVNSRFILVGTIVERLRMRRICLGVTSGALSFLCFTGSAMAGASIVGPAEPRGSRPPMGFEWSARAALDAPYGDTAEGVDDGFQCSVGFTSILSRTEAVGVSLGYAGWRSSEAGLFLDRLFSGISGTSIHGSKVSMGAVDLDLRVHVVPLPDRASFLQLDCGVGIRRSTSRVELPAEQLRAAGFTVTESVTSAKATYEPIAMAGLGIDLFRASSMKAGLDVTQLWWIGSDAGTVRFLRIGGHVTLRHR